ncbi:MAG: hypothetical protein P1U56_20170, partial [Saprospiraceae bacterium]|nr:hypothetical protein [Saprospiraceae bacterium]
MKKLNSAFFVLFITLVVCTSVHSQKETVILYNSQPVKVELSEKGNIQSFIGLMPGYMAGYDLSPAINIPSNENVVDLADVEQKGYDIISINRIQLNYKPNFATLDKAVIDQLNTVAAKMRTSPEQRVLLTAHTTDQKQSKL